MQNSIEYELQEDDILYFLHIEKTAGTSLMNLLDSFFDYEDICQATFWRDLLQITENNLSRYHLFHGHFGYAIHRLLSQKPIYLTVLRDPVNRIISDYYFRLEDPDSGLLKMYTGKSIPEILEDPHRKMILADNLQTKYIGLDPDMMSSKRLWKKEKNAVGGIWQILYLMSREFSDEELLKKAKQNLFNFKFIGILEKFEESMMLLYYTFGWRPLTKNWTLNVTPKSKQKDFSQETIKIIKRHNNLDVELYDLGKNFFEERFTKMVEDLREKYYKSSYDNLPFRETIYKMLEKHYQHRFNESHIQPQKSIYYDFKQKLSGSGWYWREILEETGEAFRWTGPETTSTIDFAVSQKEDLVIQFRVMRTMSSDLLDSLTLKVNEHPIEIKILDGKEQNMMFEGFIPKSALSNKKDFVRISFEINRTINPHEINPSDPTDRPLGLSMDRIKITPAKEFDKTKD